MIVFFVLAALLLAQSCFSVAGGGRFLRLVRKSLQAPAGPYHPAAAVIIPCKGRDADLERNAPLFLKQDYAGSEIIFVVASEADPAFPFLQELVNSVPSANAAVVVAGFSECNGEKVHNLLAGLRAAGPGARVLAFADIDAAPPADWLRTLVAPLADPKVTVSTGYRWYLPGASFASWLRAAWDSSIATMMGKHSHNLAWGGSMAMRRADFERLRIAEDHWRQTVSDDYSLARAVRQAGGYIRFEPKCLVPSRNPGGVREFFRWANRQIIITRVYRPALWRLGVASYSLYALTFIWGLVLIGLHAGARAPAIALLGAILALGALTGIQRGAVARLLFCHKVRGQHTACYWLLSPVIPWIMWANFLTAAFTRRIVWRGTKYELKSDRSLVVIRRDAS